MLHVVRSSLISWHVFKQDVAIRFTEQQKKIGLIAFFAISCLALLYLCYNRCCFRAQASLLNENGDEDLLSKGKRLIQEEKFQEAEKVFEEILALEPKNIDALVGYAESLLEHDEMDQASGYLTEALTLGPNHAHALGSFARLLVMRGEFIDAQMMIDKALQLAPTVPVFHLIKGDILFALNDFTGAEASYTEAIQLQKKMSKELPDLLWQLYQKGEDRAELTLNLCHKLLNNMKYQKPLTLFAEKLYHKECFYDAAGVYGLILSHNPTNVNALNHYAEALFKLDEMEGALEFFEKVLKLDPKNALALDYLPKVREALKKYDKIN